MTKRTKSKQSKHDTAIKRSAIAYSRMGYNVHADISGYKKPKTIFGRKPDLTAKKGQREIILEMETSDSFKKDRAQRAAFRKYANQSKKRKFRTKKV